MRFHSKMAWTPVLLMMSYLATIVTDHHLTYLKMRARGIDEQLLKTSGAEVLSPRKKIRKNLKGGGQPSSPPPPHPPCTSEG